MATLFDEIFYAIRGRCISDDSASVAAAEVVELVVKKFTDVQQLKAEIAAIVAKSVPCCKNGAEWFEVCISFAEMERLRQLS